MFQAFPRRSPFLIAAALVAAAIADPLVESLSNAGLFGGSYADNNHLCVLPAFFAGVALCVVLAALRCGDVWRSAATGNAPDWLLHTARDIAKRSPVRDVPLVLAVQLLMLFAMESGEQFLAGGRILGGTLWLGGPVAISLATHALVGIATLFALRTSMRAILRTFATLLRAAIRHICVLLARPAGGGFRAHTRSSTHLRTQAPHVRQIGGRAPPPRLTPAHSYF